MPPTVRLAKNAVAQPPRHAACLAKLDKPPISTSR